jgi:hypothetical protein
MTRQAHAAVAACAVVAILTMAAPLAAQDSLTAARQLYASAEYQGALTMLNTLRAANPSAVDRQSIELYRTFCLVAIGNTDEANEAIAAMVTRDPLYRPNMDDVPPRLRTVFSDQRKRLLPSIIQQKYVQAKAAFDQSDFKAATDGFTQVMIALSDPDVAAAAAQPPLSDLKILASSFNELTVRALAPPPAPVPVAAPVPAVAPEPAVARTPRIYGLSDADVTAPTALRQELPPYPGKITFEKTGVVEVVVDETGAVESATMAEPLDTVYNRLVLAATKTWLYRPARLDSAPVKYRKRIQISLARQP